MLPPEILIMILKYVDFKTLGSFSMVSESFRILAEEVLRKVYDMVEGTFINMSKLEMAEFDEILEMRKIIVSVDEIDKCLLVKNFIYYSTKRDLCLVQDIDVSEFLLSPLDHQVLVRAECVRCP